MSSLHLPPMLWSSDAAWTDLGGGVRRKILTHDASVMMVRVVFAKGAVGAPHHHPHIQCTLVASGRFEECITTQLFRYAAGRREEVRDLVGLRVHARIGGLIALVGQEDPVGDRVGDRLENVGEVELHGDSLGRVRRGRVVCVLVRGR